MEVAPPPPPPEGEQPASSAPPIAAAAAPEPAPSPALPPTPAARRIVVSQPQKSADSVGAHYLWQVSSTDLETSRHSSVRRRYNDWLFLKAQLQREAAGAILPLLPEKNAVMGKLAQDEFMEARRRGLQAFLTGAAEHPLLGSLGVLDQFLESTDAEWSAVVSAAEEGSGLADSAHSMIRWVRDTTNKLQNSYTDSGRAQVSEADPSFKETEDYVATLQAQLGALGQGVSALAAQARERGFAEAAVGDGLRMLAQTERRRAELAQAAATKGDALSPPGPDLTGRGGGSEGGGGGAEAGVALSLEHSADGCARLAATAASLSATLATLGETFEEQAATTVAVQEAVDVRAALLAAWQVVLSFDPTASQRRFSAASNRLFSLQTCQSDVVSATDALRKARAGGDGVGAAKAQTELSAAEAAEAAARGRYNTCVRRMDEELVSYDRARHEVLRRTVRSLVVAGAGAAEQHARLWQEALSAIDAADPSLTLL